MTTIYIAAAVLVICLSAALVFLIIKYMKEYSELTKKEEELEVYEKQLQKKKNDLDLWQSQLTASAKKTAKYKTVRAYAKAPSEKVKYLKRNLALQLGYKVLDYCDINETSQDDITTYYTAINILPENEKK